MDFNNKALAWDSEERIRRAKIIADEILRTIPIKPGDRALEFGCGTGLITFNLLEQFQHITLIDTSEGMLERLHHKIKEAKVNHLTVYHRDINREPLLTEKFNVIYTSMALHHIADTGTTLENLYKMLKENGYLCIVELDKDDGGFHKNEEGFHGHHGFNRGELKALLQDLGFRDVTSSTIYQDNKAVEGKKIDFSLFLMKGQK